MGLFDYLVMRGDTGVRVNPVPRGMAARRAGTGSARPGTPLLRAPRTLPRVLLPAEVDALLAVLRTHRDRAMVEAMLLGGLRRCEVLGLRLGEVKVGERRLFIAEGKGGHQRIVPISPRFLASLARYLELERPADPGTDRVFQSLPPPTEMPPRVRAHVLICMLAQYLVWHLRRALAPLTYTDEHPPVRDNPVAPATRSAHAERKAAHHTTTECRPVRSFRSLLEHLATLTRNTITVGDRTFDKISTPTTEQQRAFDLLGAPIPLTLR